MWNVPPLKAWNATKSPLGDQLGCEGSRKVSVNFFAAPPVIGRDQSAPCRSMMSCVWSGERVKATLVPSVTFTLRGKVGLLAGAATEHVTKAAKSVRLAPI